MRSRLISVLAVLVFSSAALAQARGGPPGGPPGGGPPGGWGPGGPPPGYRPPGTPGGPPGNEARRPNLPPPPITVIKHDGERVVGTLTAADADKLTVQPLDKSAEPLLIPWKEIRSVSGGGGVNRAKLLETWKAEHAGQLCATCHGDRLVRCDTCKGTGHDPASAEGCETCSGKMLIPCRTPKCENGIIPCPKSCLKRSEGQWFTRDGKFTRTFRNPDGTMATFTEDNFGEVVVREGNTWVNKGKCTTCNGETTIPDPACLGTGERTCVACTRRDAPKCTAEGCTAGMTECAPCRGTGLANPPAPGTASGPDAGKSGEDGPRPPGWRPDYTLPQGGGGAGGGP